MYNDETVTLCGSSGYEKKFYFNDAFDNLPDSIKDELKIMCVLFTEEVSCILTLDYDEKGNLNFNIRTQEDDLLFDEVSCGLKIKELQTKKRDLLEALEMYYRVFALGETAAPEDEDE
ncbi:MAG: DUF6145 family protein [Lachnospiraceae bacterium]|nr:DUF6145 family protein [Lachnospiraceae bacterium]MDY5577447.1 DUF6145 family protein [Lachnospiraceae bacterium]